MIKKSGFGDLVAASMSNIMDSDEHRQLFKSAAAKECCDCKSNCGKKCPCKKDDKKCKKACKNCAKVNEKVTKTKKKAYVMNDVLSQLSKLSALQERLGLEKSALATMTAMGAMVTELRRLAHGDDLVVHDEEGSDDFPPIEERHLSDALAPDTVKGDELVGEDWDLSEEKGRDTMHDMESPHHHHSDHSDVHLDHSDLSEDLGESDDDFLADDESLFSDDPPTEHEDDFGRDRDEEDEWEDGEQVDELELPIDDPEIRKMLTDHSDESDDDKIPDHELRGRHKDESFEDD